MAHGGEFRTTRVRADRYGQFYVSWRSANGHDGVQDNDESYLSSTAEPTATLYDGAIIKRTNTSSNGGTDFKFEQYGGTSDQTATFNVTCYPMCGTAVYGRHYSYRGSHHGHYETRSGDSYCTVNLEPPNTKYFKSGCASYSKRSFTDSLTAENLTGYGSTTTKKEVGVQAAFVDGLTIHIRKTHNSKDLGVIALAFTPDDDLTVPDGMYGQYNIISAQSGKYYGVKGTLTGGNRWVSVSMAIDAYYTFDGTTYTPIINKGSISVALTEDYHNSKTQAFYFIADDTSSTSYYAYVIIPGFTVSSSSKTTALTSDVSVSFSTKYHVRYYTPTYVYDDEYQPKESTFKFHADSTMVIGIPIYGITIYLASSGVTNDRQVVSLKLYSVALKGTATSYSSGSSSFESLGLIKGTSDGDPESTAPSLDYVSQTVESDGNTFVFALTNGLYVRQSRTYCFAVAGLSAKAYIYITVEPAAFNYTDIACFRWQSYAAVFYFSSESEDSVGFLTENSSYSLVSRENFIYAKFTEEHPEKLGFLRFAGEVLSGSGKHFSFVAYAETRRVRSGDKQTMSSVACSHIKDISGMLGRYTPSTKVVRADTGKEVDFVEVVVGASARDTIINVLPHSESDMPDEGVFVLTTTGIPYFWIKPNRLYYVGNSDSRRDTPFVWKSDEEDEEETEE